MLGPSLSRPGALLGELAARAAPLLRGFPSPELAAKELSAFSRSAHRQVRLRPALATSAESDVHSLSSQKENLNPIHRHPNAWEEHSLVRVVRRAQEPSASPQPRQLGALARELRRLRLGALLLSAGESARAADSDGAAAGQGGGIFLEVGGLRYGERYVYDAGALAARLGRPLAAQLPAVRRLCGSMRCARCSLCQKRFLFRVQPCLFCQQRFVSRVQPPLQLKAPWHR